VFHQSQTIPRGDSAESVAAADRQVHKLPHGGISHRQCRLYFEEPHSALQGNREPAAQELQTDRQRNIRGGPQQSVVDLVEELGARAGGVGRGADSQWHRIRSRSAAGFLLRQWLAL